MAVTYFASRRHIFPKKLLKADVDKDSITLLVFVNGGFCYR